jgi:hypothetical protein
MLQALRDPLRVFTDFVTQPASYIVFTDGARYYAKNGSTGAIEYSDTDISRLLQNVINTLYTQYGGGRVFIRRGTYYPSRTIAIPDGISLVVEGEGNNTIFKYTRRFLLFIHRNEASPTWSSVIVFRNFKVDRTGSGNNNTDIFSITYARFVKFENIEVVDDYREVHGDAGISGYNNVVAVAENCRVYNKSYGIWLFGLLSILRGNYVQNTAYVGIAGAGLLPDFKLPPGFSPGGITVIEDNVCVDCGRVDEAIAVDYGSEAPSAYGVGIIRNNKIITRDYTTNRMIVGVNVDKIIVEGNELTGTVTNMPIVMGGNRGSYATIRNNIVNVVVRGTNHYPIANNHETTLFDGNRIDIAYEDITANVEAIVWTFGMKVFIRNNRISVSLPSGVRLSRFLSPDMYGTDSNPSLLVVEGNYLALVSGAGVDTGIRVLETQSYSTARPLAIVRDNLVFTPQINDVMNISTWGNVEYAIVENNMANVEPSIAHIGAWTRAPSATLYIHADRPVRRYTAAIVVVHMKRNSGVARMPAGSTRVTVPHSLITTPSKVLVTPYGNARVWVENITSTSFDIVTDVPPTADLRVAWYAEV